LELKRRIQLVRESVQEFAATTNHLAHHTHIGLPKDLISKEVVHAFTNGIRQQDIRHLLLGEKKTVRPSIRPSSYRQLT
jgi:hypothetical protein